MLQLKNIVKTYAAGDTEVRALRGINLCFGKNEFVAVLGPSGCGKTTLLNIIGGLDHCDEGDLVVNGVSTKNFTDGDFDAYRNHSVGFIFQSYNLIPHQNVLSNVELALTLSGVSKAKRRQKALESLRAVGIEDQAFKKPNQMSGGQMQRVAIARALVNDPEILLADEPTGALDTENSVQLMEILSKIAETRLVIMVTHNPDLANKYATRTVNMLDGKIISDSNPPPEEPEKPEEKEKNKKKKKVKKPSMSFGTALSLSMNNLMTKKGRTVLTSFAGSMGIIGIALILALSSGVQGYINRVQEDTLSSYPIHIKAETVDVGNLLRSIQEVRREAEEQQSDEELGDRVYSGAVMYELFNTLNSRKITKNNLSDFKKYLETPNADGKKPLDDATMAIQYAYNLNLNVYTKDTDGKIIRSDASELLKKIAETVYGTGGSAQIPPVMRMSQGQGFDIWEEMLGGESGCLVHDILKQQYDLLYGDWPDEYNEVVLVVDKNNTVSDLVLYSLGMISGDKLAETIKASSEGKEVKIEKQSWTFEEICRKKLKYIPNFALYNRDGKDGKYKKISDTEAGLSYLFDNAEELKISGIIRENKDAVASMMTGSIGYTYKLAEHITELTAASEIVQRQLSDKDIDVITSLPFGKDADALTTAQKAGEVEKTLKNADVKAKAEAYTAIMTHPSEEYITSVIRSVMAPLGRPEKEARLLAGYKVKLPDTSEEDLKKYISGMDDDTLDDHVKDFLRGVTIAEYAETAMQELKTKTPDELASAYDAKKFSPAQYALLYDDVVKSKFSKSTYEDNLKLLGYIDKDDPVSMNIFASSFANKEKIADAIAGYNDGTTEENKINYVDYVQLLISSVTTIINAISYVLMAFVSISLVVSSVMIGVITYISVLERTKEIGILRAMGASKKDVKRVFNAETMIVGFSAGVIGILTTVLLCVPVNLIIRRLTGIKTLSAFLPPAGAVILIGISVVLTLIAGLIPSALAAKKDPVIALRTE